MPAPAPVALRTEHPLIAGVATRGVWAEPPADAVNVAAPKVLFLHGFSDSADTWRRVQTRLAAAGITSLAVDQPSHGEAGTVDISRPLVEQYVEFAAEAAKVLEAGRPVVVVGNSLGGAHALLLGQHHPDLVAGIVAIAPASFDHPRWFTSLDPTRDRNGQPTGAAPRITLDSKPPAAVLAARRALGGPGMRVVGFGRPWRAPSGFIEGWQARFNDPERIRAIRDLLTKLPDEYIHADPIDLSKITAPVLGLFGTRDRLVKPSSGKAMKAGLADVEITLLKGIGHMPQLECPGLTTKFLRRFIDRIAEA